MQNVEINIAMSTDELSGLLAGIRQNDKSRRIEALQIHIKDNVLSPEECTNLIKLIDAEEKLDGEVYHYDSVKKMEDVRQVKQVRNEVPLANDILRRLILTEAEPFYGVTIEYWDTPQLLAYGPGGHYDVHADDDVVIDRKVVRVWDRDFSLVVFLNENYVGGNLVFPNHMITVTPKTGRMVLFPSDGRYMHGAEEVKSGTRYQLVSWLTRIGSRRECSEPRLVIFRNNQC